MPSIPAALWFLPFALPVAIWVAWSDVKFMKIPNMAGYAILAAYLALGWIALPWQVWLWGLALGAVVLVTGFVLNIAGAVGAGDAKFAAAMAPMFVEADPRFLSALFAACLLGAFASHRLLARVTAFRLATADWASWTRKDFPMGLALAGTLVLYLASALVLR